MMTHQVPRNKRLTAKWCRPEECTAAIRGQSIPQALGDRVTQSCVVRGIRYHPEYAKEFAKEVPDAGPVFVRALNARSIMSNIIPEITDPEHFPYCIWHPAVASEQTYRDLAQRYPNMQYEVGRACAVAGYAKLYTELKLLPDVHIAEEARDNGNMEIFDAIMSHNIKYSIMDDYNRTVRPSSRTPSVLNGDTAVRSHLEIKHKHGRPWKDADWTFYTFGMDHEYVHFDITEDLSVDEYDSPRQSIRDVVKLLYTPLPADLPAIPSKDLLILMAAHRGDIDRYSRLRRPKMIYREVHCIVRGIYHNIFFAKWWSLQPLEALDKNHRIRKAITARFIMSNDLSRIHASTPWEDIPYCIWYPALPRPAILRDLLHRRSDMKHEVARACIVANYNGLYDELDADPDEALLFEAKGSANPHYLADLERKAAEGRQGKEIGGGYMGWKRYNRTELFEPSSMWLNKDVDARDIMTDFEWIYDGVMADASSIELNACISDTIEGEEAEKLEVKGHLDLEFVYDRGII